VVVSKSSACEILQSQRTKYAEAKYAHQPACLEEVLLEGQVLGEFLLGLLLPVMAEDGVP
jgi:hypothetical protein